MPAGGTLSGTVTGTLAGNVRVLVRHGGIGGNQKFLNTRTRGDGTFTITLPANTYDRVRFSPSGGGTTDSSGVVVLINQDNSMGTIALP